MDEPLVLVDQVVDARRVVVELRVERPLVLAGAGDGPRWKLRALVGDLEACNLIVPYIAGDEQTQQMLATCGMFAGGVLAKLALPHAPVVVEPLTGYQRAQLDERFRSLLRSELANGATVDDVAYLLTRMLPEVLADPGEAFGHVAAAYGLAMPAMVKAADA